MKRLAILWIIVGTPVAAGPIDDAARPCLVERLDQARAACLGYIADEREAKTEGRIATATVDLQAATAEEIQAFERELEISQKRWRDRVQAECRRYFPGDQVAYQRCRLGEAIARDKVVRTTLDQARVRMGLDPLARVPDEIEVLIPLPDAPAGPDADLRVPLVVPIRP
ncbi:MAG: hypothetical protein AAF557_15590 [Pseudomonadota bacterium]